MKEAWDLLRYWIFRAIYLPAIQDHFHRQIVLHLKEYPSYFLPPLHSNFWKLGELQHNRLAELYSWGNKIKQPFVSLQWLFQVIKCILLVKAWTMLLLLIFSFFIFKVLNQHKNVIQIVCVCFTREGIIDVTKCLKYWQCILLHFPWIFHN